MSKDATSDGARAVVVAAAFGMANRGAGGYLRSVASAGQHAHAIVQPPVTLLPGAGNAVARTEMISGTDSIVLPFVVPGGMPLAG